MAGRFNIVARAQFRACTTGPSNATYHMISPARWHILVSVPPRECLFELEIPVDFPLNPPRIAPLSADFGPICTDGATSVLGAVEVAAAEIPIGASVDRVKFAAELDKIAESAAGYSAKWAAIH